MGARLRVGIDARILTETAPMGVSRFMAALFRAVSDLAPQHEYFLYVRDTSFRDPFFTSAPFVPRILAGNPILTSPLVWQQLYLPWRAWRDRVDVLFSPYYCGPLYAPMPQVVCICDISFSVFPRDFPSWLQFKPKLLARPSSWRAAKVMTISEFSRQELLRVYGLPPEKVVVIHAGVEAQYWRRERAQLEPSPRRSFEFPFFLFIGSLLPRRQVDAVVQALARLPVSYHLVVAGERDATKLAQLKATAARWQVAERVMCVGHVSDTELEMLYAHAVALVSPSTYEGFGLPVLEAMAHGTPVIAWDIPVMREVVGGAGVLLPCGRIEDLAQAMRRFGEDAQFRLNFREKGRRRLQRFSWREAAGLFLTMLHEAGQGHAAPETANL
jgi:glycosyltransferase involved in cell wall biosynthesis